LLTSKVYLIWILISDTLNNLIISFRQSVTRITIKKYYKAGGEYFTVTIVKQYNKSKNKSQISEKKNFKEL